MYEKFGQFIDGKWQQSSDKSTYEVINPANEEVIGSCIKSNTHADVDKALKSAAKGWFGSLEENTTLAKILHY